jgi:hypothetical protein
MAKAASAAPHPLQDFKPESLRGACGFVRVGQTHAGQWWFLDARDHPFFSRGVAAVNRWGRAGARGAQPTPYELAVERLHGVDDALPFVRSVLGRLRAWKCNTLGAWTAAEFFDCGMYYTETVGFRQAAPETTIKLCGALLPDVFDPRWAEACDLLAAETCLAHRESRDLLGYFSDCGLQWAQPRVGPAAARGERPSLLQICLSLEPSFPAYHAAWEFALAPHGGNFETLAQAWEIEPNKQALRQLTLADTPLVSAGYRRDHERFTREFARRYFQTCAAAIRHYDPNHLILGCRSEAPPGAAVLVEAVAPAVDVLSITCDREAVFETLDEYWRTNAMPLLLAEFSWSGEGFTQKNTGPDRRRLTTIERMLAKGRLALARAVAHPALVGWAWSRWADGPEDAPPFGQGLVHLDDSEAREHSELFADLNARAEALRRAAARPAGVAAAGAVAARE